MLEVHDARELLKSLRWSEDQKVVNDFGDHIWLTVSYREGKRIGITDCCLVSEPCDYHAQLTHSAPGEKQ